MLSRKPFDCPRNDAVNEADLRARLPIDGLGRRLFFYESTDSTNARALAALEDGSAEDGDLHVAIEQTAGRGSRGRPWHSPAGAGLWFSLVRLHEPPSPVSFWPGLALKRTLSAWEIKSWIKWPNDLIVDDRKIAGVLVEAPIRGSTPLGWVIGVGVNLGQESFPPDLADLATSVRRETGEMPSAAAFLGSLLIQMKEIERDDLHLLDLIRDEGDLIGRRLAVRRGEEEFQVTVKSLTSRGHLHVRRDDGGDETWVSSSDLELRPHPGPAAD
jgi:BirA family transcriptional regulator, biotin operon repressor / biotin---[acetyl-CoA-carboxylase] ligase